MSDLGRDFFFNPSYQLGRVIISVIRLWDLVPCLCAGVAPG